MITKQQIKKDLIEILRSEFAVSPDNASDGTFYKAVSILIRDILEEKQATFSSNAISNGRKEVNYLCMEFLMGRSLKTSLTNLGLTKELTQILKEYEVKLENLYDYEPDAGLGNGGLGRLAACYLDGLATCDYPAFGYSILYEFGIFKQKIIDGWQTELPDNWLPGGKVWLKPLPEISIDVSFGGDIEEFWENGYHHVRYVNTSVVKAIPYDLYVSGYNSKGVSVLRLWQAQSPHFDMESFNRGDYANASIQNSFTESISKVLYPNDNHIAGKRLRLHQQYFLSAASIGDIFRRYLSNYSNMDRFPERVAIHINDTHPTLAIPELMRILLDECGYGWDDAWSIVSRTFAYTNHTVMSEALEKWNEDLFRETLPRIYQIILEINRRFCESVFNQTHDGPMTQRMSIVQDHEIHMANLCVAASHAVNGVSQLHSQIIKEDVFNDFYLLTPYKFKNVTNGIAFRRWLLQSNPSLTNLLKETIGDKFLRDASELSRFRQYENNKGVQEKLTASKQENKENFVNYLQKKTGKIINPHSIFDVQVKRLHEYKRQHMNALHILSEYFYLKENPNVEFTPKTYIFGAKAAPGYYLAKQIIKLLCSLSDMLDKDADVRDKLSVVFLEDYSVTLSELLIPASEISEQISLAGTEASGTGNMKLMLNGAITLGTLDGANIEIRNNAGEDNYIAFGMTAPEVHTLLENGYYPSDYYNSDANIKAVIDSLTNGTINGENFSFISDTLKKNDTYMALADLSSFNEAQNRASQLYNNREKWLSMSINNIAGACFFSADRAVKEYATNIWGLE